MRARYSQDHTARLSLGDLPGLPDDLVLGPSDVNPWLIEPDLLEQSAANTATVTFAESDWIGEHASDTLADDDQFWATVTRLRHTVAEKMSKVLQGAPQRTREEQVDLGRELIGHAVREAIDDAVVTGESQRWTSAYTRRITEATFDAQFGLGRLQPLVDDPSVENIKVYGHDRVFLIKAAGQIEQAGPVARNDDELTDFLNHLASRETDLDRSFTRHSPFLDLPLPGRTRLAAAGWVTASGRPEVTIRIQRLRDATLPMLQRVGEVDSLIADFLRAAVRASCSIVISGRGQGSGKTTLLRALADEIPPWEAVATIETEPELYLHEDTDNHPLVNSYLTRRGSAERDEAGRRIGEITTLDIIPSALRHNISRIVVSEVRHHSELAAMLEAMQMGNGSMTTVHADSVKTLISRLVRMATYSTGNPEHAHKEVGDLLDLAVYIGIRRDPATGKVHRYVEDISEISYSPDSGSAIAHQIFGSATHAGAGAVPDQMPSPSLSTLLREAGWDADSFIGHPTGTWVN